MARRQKVDEEEHNYWMSYSDMMAALFLVFILIISFTLVKYEHGQKELFNQNKELQDAKKKSEEKEEKLKKIIGVKADIIDALNKRFREKNIGITVDESGAFNLESNILFDVDKSELKKDVRSRLETILREYLEGLFEYENEISEIIIEGHTDKDGVPGRSEDENYLYNLKLSQDRALSVAKFCVDSNNKIFRFKIRERIEKLKKILTAKGRYIIVHPKTNEKTGKFKKKDIRRVEH